MIRRWLMGPLRLDVDLRRVGRPRLAHGPGFVSIAWGRSWTEPTWSIEVELPHR